MSEHALLSPSSAARWAVCPGSVALSKNFPDQANEYAREGTCAHHVAEMCLKRGHDASAYVGLDIFVEEDKFTVDRDMAAAVQMYLDIVRRESTGKTLLVEQKLPLTPITGEIDAKGTSDAVIISEDVLAIYDYKHGMGLKVLAKENEQLMLYAASAFLEYNIAYDFKKFKVAVVQPRIDNFDEWEFSRDEMEVFLAKIRAVAPRALDGTGELAVSEKGCQWCRAKASCPELTKQVEAMVSGGFEDLDKTSEADLSASMRAVDMVEGWCRSVRSEVERRLIAGVKVIGYKLVQGRRGARQWLDAAAVEAEMRKLKLPEDVIYKKSLLTPTQIEKSIAKTNEEAWSTLAAMTVQKEGLPSVAASTDPRPEFNAGDGFGDLDAQ